MRGLLNKILVASVTVVLFITSVMPVNASFYKSMIECEEYNFYNYGKTLKLDISNYSGKAIKIPKGAKVSVWSEGIYPEISRSDVESYAESNGYIIKEYDDHIYLDDPNYNAASVASYEKYEGAIFDSNDEYGAIINYKAVKTVVIKDKHEKCVTFKRVGNKKYLFSGEEDLSYYIDMKFKRKDKKKWKKKWYKREFTMYSY